MPSLSFGYLNLISVAHIRLLLEELVLRCSLLQGVSRLVTNNH